MIWYVLIKINVQSFIISKNNGKLNFQLSLRENVKNERKRNQEKGINLKTFLTFSTFFYKLLTSSFFD